MELLVATPCLEVTGTPQEDPGEERGKHGAGTWPLGVPEAPALSILLPASRSLWPHAPLLKRTGVFKQSLLLLFSLREQRGRGCPTHAATAHLPHLPRPSARAPACLSSTPGGPGPWGPRGLCSVRLPVSKGTLQVLLSCICLCRCLCLGRPPPSQPRACKAIPSRQPAGRAPTLGEPTGPALRCHGHRSPSLRLQVWPPSPEPGSWRAESQRPGVVWGSALLIP